MRLKLSIIAALIIKLTVQLYKNTALMSIIKLLASYNTFRDGISRKYQYHGGSLFQFSV